MARMYSKRALGIFRTAFLQCSLLIQKEWGQVDMLPVSLIKEWHLFGAQRYPYSVAKAVLWNSILSEICKASSLPLLGKLVSFSRSWDKMIYNPIFNSVHFFIYDVFSIWYLILLCYYWLLFLKIVLLIYCTLPRVACVRKLQQTISS